MSAPWSARRLRTRSPAPATTTIASDTWPTTRPWRSACAPGPAEAPRPPPRSHAPGSPRADRSAGSSPASSAAAAVAASAKNSTRASAWIISRLGSSGGARATSTRTAAKASPVPSTPPRSASVPLSVRSWRTRRPRPAPSALRTASSRVRAEPRTSSRLATLTQAIRRRSPTAATAAHTVARASPVTSSGRGVRTGFIPRSAGGRCGSVERRNAAASSRARRAATPGRRRPTRSKTMTSAGCASASSVAGKAGSTGAQTSARCGYSKPRGITPTTVNRLPFHSRARPTAAGSPPKRLCQSPWLITITGAAPGTSSAGSRVRPWTGTTPSSGKKPPVTQVARRASGRPASSMTCSWAPW
jgi:hypothetical protein